MKYFYITIFAFLASCGQTNSDSSKSEIANTDTVSNINETLDTKIFTPEFFEYKNNLLYEINEKDPFTGILINKYPSGEIMKETYKDGLLNGPFISYTENGNISSKGSYIIDIARGSQFDGEVKFWYDNGQLESFSTYKNGNRVVESKRWYTDGVLQTHWVENEFNKFWYESGKPSHFMFYDKTYLEYNKDSMWYENGILKRQCSMKKCSYWDSLGAQIIIPSKIVIIDSLPFGNRIKKIEKIKPLNEYDIFIYKTKLGSLLESLDQSFSFKSNNTDYVYFAISGSKVYHYILINNNTLYRLPTFFDRNKDQEISAISFDDINKDGFSDIIEILSFYIGAGENRNKLVYFSNIYFGTPDGFKLKDDIPEKLIDCKTIKEIKIRLDKEY